MKVKGGKFMKVISSNRKEQEDKPESLSTWIKDFSVLDQYKKNTFIEIENYYEQCLSLGVQVSIPELFPYILEFANMLTDLKEENVTKRHNDEERVFSRYFSLVVASRKDSSYKIYKDSSYKIYCESYCKDVEEGAWIGIDKPYFEKNILSSKGLDPISISRRLQPIFKFFEENDLPLSQILLKVSDRVIQEESEGKLFTEITGSSAMVYMAVDKISDAVDALTGNEELIFSILVS